MLNDFPVNALFHCFGIFLAVCLKLLISVSDIASFGEPVAEQMVAV